MALLVTTSRKPCARTRTLAKDLHHILLHSKYFNRGKSSLDHVAELARANGFDHALIISERNGNPSQLRFIEVFEDDWQWVGPSINIQSVKLCREFQGYKRTKPQAITVDDTLGIASLFSAEVSDEGPIALKLDKEKISFYFSEKEIGPRMVISSIR